MSVEINPEKVRQIGKDIEATAIRPGINLDVRVTVMGALTEQAFLDGPGAEGFPEGAEIARIIGQHLSDLQFFSRDARAGIKFSGNAAQVAAVMYVNADVSARQSVDDIAFLFGASDARPAGYKGSSVRFSDLTGHSPARPDAQSEFTSPGDIWGYSTSTDIGTVHWSSFADGSGRSTSSVGTDLHGTDTTTVTDASGHVISRYERESHLDQAGNQVTTTTQVDGPPGDATVRKTVVTVEKVGGYVTVTSSVTHPDGTTESTTLTEDAPTVTSPVQKSELYGHG
jgi:hypothetical protein